MRMKMKLAWEGCEWPFVLGAFSPSSAPSQLSSIIKWHNSAQVSTSTQLLFFILFVLCFLLINLPLSFFPLSRTKEGAWRSRGILILVRWQRERSMQKYISYSESGDVMKNCCQISTFIRAELAGILSVCHKKRGNY